MSLPPSPFYAPAPAPQSASHSLQSLSKLIVHVFHHLFPIYATADLTPMVTFVKTLLRRIPTQPTTLFLALQYLAACAHSQDPMLMHFMARHGKRPNTSTLSQSRTISVDPLLLLTAAIATANDFTKSAHPTPDHYSTATGLNISALLHAKQLICTALQWQFIVPPNIYEQWVGWLKQFALRRSRETQADRRRAVRKQQYMMSPASQKMTFMIKDALLERMGAMMPQVGLVQAAIPV
ncbi:hypothetical protein DFJ77DRAFT_473626 [Powellomyces hirtus]|nr:hypothetical protein DFJ77DRAFT_473626 [Powellomyces hirtus]